MKECLEEFDFSTSSSSGCRDSAVSSEESQIESGGIQRRRTVKGIVVKHLENSPFSSTLSAFLDLHEISVPLSSKESKKLRREMKREVNTLAIHLREVFGFFNWEKEALGVSGGISSKDFRIRSSFTPTFGMYQDLKCLLHFQMKLKRFSKEMNMNRVMLGNTLPPEEEILRKNLLIDLAMILQHQVKVLITSMQRERDGGFEPKVISSLGPPKGPHLKARTGTPGSGKSGSLGSPSGGTQVAAQDPLRGWKSLLTVRDVSFEESDGSAGGTLLLHSCTILPLEGSRKGFVIFRKVEDNLVRHCFFQYLTLFY